MMKKYAELNPFRGWAVDGHIEAKVVDSRRFSGQRLWEVRLKGRLERTSGSFQLTRDWTNIVEGIIPEGFRPITLRGKLVRGFQVASPNLGSGDLPPDGRFFLFNYSDKGDIWVRGAVSGAPAWNVIYQNDIYALDSAWECNLPD